MTISVVCECGFERSEAEIKRDRSCPACGRPQSNSRRGVSSLGGLALGLVFIGVALWAGLQLRDAVGAAREAARRSQCVGYFTQIALAMHVYHEAHGSFPAAAMTDKNGQALLSWRVTILPYIGRDPLYAQFHLDEPWDSPHNITLLDQMPSNYACPSDSSHSPGMTNFQAIVGVNTAFRPDFKPLRIADFTDGTANTILVAETERAVPWTKPEDVPFATDLPLHGLGSPHYNGFNARFADGFGRYIKNTIAPATLDAILTRNGNEPVDVDEL